jgi:hypothetical protein
MFALLIVFTIGVSSLVTLFVVSIFGDQKD